MILSHSSRRQYLRQVILMIYQNQVVSHTTSKPFYRLEFVLERIHQLSINFLCPYQGCKSHKWWHLLAEPSPWDWFALPQMIYNLVLVRLWAEGKRNNSYDEWTNAFSPASSLFICECRSCWMLVSDVIAELILTAVASTWRRCFLPRFYWEVLWMS